ncbi:MAG: hypothetical protein BZ137_08565 [Methanosphaera sp. rholeuAM130]|nr:MAG: hypothetical protein BZ137_08565 [Methanosphaera sp. rholeuAM130]
MDESDKNNLTYVLVDRTPEDNSSDNHEDTHMDNQDNDSVSKLNSQTGHSTQRDNVDSTDNINYCISVSLLSIMAYVIIAYSSNVSLLELVDLEVPLIIFLSLIIVFLSTNWSRIYAYVLFIIMIVILIAFDFNYSFLLMIVLFSELIIYSLNRIMTNKKDYAYMDKYGG